jgi:hypothetical protein
MSYLTLLAYFWDLRFIKSNIHTDTAEFESCVIDAWFFINWSHELLDVDIKLELRNRIAHNHIAIKEIDVNCE